MPGSIGRDEVVRLVRDENATLAEVLPRAEYDWAHLAGAVHLPLKGWSTAALRDTVDADRPVVVYCHDYQ